jgi:hypothetical protein
MEIPVLRVFLDVLVNRVAVLQHAADQRVGEQARLGLLGGGRRQFDRLAPGGRAFFPGDGRRALRVPEFIASARSRFSGGFKSCWNKNCTARSRASRRLPIIQLHHAAEHGILCA